MFSCTSSGKAENKAKGPSRLIDKTARATGYCAGIVAEKRASDGAAFVLPAKWYKRDRKRIVVDDFDLEGIRRAVHEFYSNMKYPTLESFLHCSKKEVYLMVSVLLSEKSFGSLVLSTSK